MWRPYTLFSLIWGVVIFVFSTVQIRIPLRESIPHGDKLLHLLEFAVLAALISRAFIHHCDLAVARRARGMALVIAVSYGAIIEIYQRALPLRSCSLSDFLADCAGIGIALLLTGGDHG